jgi:hypothetical protein
MTDPENNKLKRQAKDLLDQTENRVEEAEANARGE